MKILIYFSGLFIAASGYLLEEADVEFSAFKVKYEKFYRTPLEESQRFAIFRNNLISIEEHNVLFQQGKTTWKQGTTKFTDWTDEEYKSMLELQKSSLNKITGAKPPEVTLKVTVPDSIDWREKGQVTEVEDQGACAASWAFSVAGSIEAAYYRKTGNLVPLSKQQLLDCTSEVGNSGCAGGHLRETMPYVEWHGLQSEESYPYSKNEEECKFNDTAVITKIDSFKYFSDNQYALEQLVGNNGPVTGTLDASEIMNYKSGIYQSENCDIVGVNLAVLVVGYGSENDTNYWIVKNCYGKSWGEDGYIRILRKANYMACGLYFENVLPIINN